ncbi:HTTM domain-containing protein [Halapricum salinum]|uniref:HTTM domain-containing protein n=1 Tax=Halapricum salinum TaxID=1457250 RepID=A0A4D6HDH1_9EURY|nr:HTTM domain-containing protein [Halapricum salinum]
MALAEDLGGSWFLFATVTETTGQQAHERFGTAVRRRVAIDLRALAAFRIALGLLLLTNLLTRARYLGVFYTDSGAFPRSTLLATHPGANQVFTYLPDPWGPILLFPVAGAFALALVVGYRTRLATAISLVLLVLLHLRNPLVLNSGDLLLRSLLVWALFLPLDRRWSIDARRYDPGTDTTANVATAAVLIQVVLVYVINATYKVDGELWRSGEAVAHVFQADQLTYLLGDLLAEFPMVLMAATYLWMVLLVASPLLLVTTGWRRTLLTSVFVAVHAGMLVSMPIGLFPLISIAGLLLFSPPSAWTTAGRLVGDSALTDRVRRWTNRVEAAVSPSGRLWPQWPGVDRVVGGIATVLPAILLVLVLLSAGSIATDTALPEPVEKSLDTTNLQQRWQMFAPYPTSTTRWMAFPANTTAGTSVDAFYGGPPDLDRPASVDSTYPSNRWRKFFQSVREDDGGPYRTAFAAYLCEQWNREHETDLSRVAIYAGDERTDPFGGGTTDSGGRYLLRHECP